MRTTKLLLVFLISFCFAEDTLLIPVVSVRPVEKIDFIPIMRATSTISAYNGAVLSLENSGIVDKIFAKPGQKIKKNDELLRLNTNSQEASLGTAQTAYQKAKAEYDRQLSLFNANVISREALDQYVVNLSDAESNLAAAQVNLDNRSLRAPYDGQVGVISISVGQYTTAGHELISLQDLSLMRILFEVDQTKASQIKPGMQFEFSSGNIKKKGEVRAIDTIVDYSTGLVTVQGTIDNKEPQFLSGQMGIVNVFLPEKKDKVVIPLAAVNFRLSGNFVYVIQNAKKTNGQTIGTAIQRIIKLGDQNQEMVLVESGLKAGEDIVVAGINKIVSSNSKVIIDTTTKTTDRNVHDVY